MRNNVYLGLVHYPVYNKNSDVVATSVTNFDIHDISRSCRTYNIKSYHIITPVDAQIELTERIISYWKDGYGKEYNHDREEAFSKTVISKSIEDSMANIESIENKKVNIITTSAKIYPNSISYEDLSNKIFNDDEIYFILFGTGFGLIEEIMDKSTYILEPIRGKSKYNHLSVRSAVSIILDRLFGEN
ncbi:MAG: RNA methyltransferase [Fusobacteria bacterium]|nr:RNA methyltransferase [Fusobacteriota bacterium]